MGRKEREKKDPGVRGKGWKSRCLKAKKKWNRKNTQNVKRRIRGVKEEKGGRRLSCFP